MSEEDFKQKNPKNLNLEPEITVFDNKRKITDFSNGNHTKLSALIQVYSPQKL
jgi:hypothetical protein